VVKHEEDEEKQKQKDEEKEKQKDEEKKRTQNIQIFVNTNHQKRI
tara:strand:+ start:42 stop:176 length:135 start_codon:yes stop_codon:yes gene_type:complete